jgi:hypothetical protein
MSLTYGGEAADAEAPRRQPDLDDLEGVLAPWMLKMWPEINLR